MMNYGGMGGNMETEMNDDGGMMISIESGDDDFDWGGRYNGEGLPRSWSAGMHYSNIYTSRIRICRQRSSSNTVT
jgi:hypothetical protein